MKAFVSVLDQVPDRHVNGVSTPFLSLKGQPLLLYVLVALDRVRPVEEIIVVGPQKRIMQVLEGALHSGVLFSKSIRVHGQNGTRIENMFSAYAESFSSGPASEDPLNLVSEEAPALFLPADIPLVTTAEIESFIAASDMTRYDYTMGISSEAALRPFYPNAHQPGIKKPYIALQDMTFRPNNLHLLRPFRVAERNPLKGLNVKPLGHSEDGGKRLEKGNWVKDLPFYFQELLIGGLDPKDIAQAANLIGKDRPLGALEAYFSRKLNIAFKMIEKWRGGGALNIDDEAAYRSVSLRLDEWRAYFLSLNRNEKGEDLCPVSGDPCQSA
ncbi:MAG: hypothetical protein ACE5GK_05625 [Nitrospiria bacterium]